jgi:hypothetical protein
MKPTMLRFTWTVGLLMAGAQPAAADWDVSFFLGRAFPTFDEQLVVRLPSVPPVPGLEILPSGTPELRADGGPVAGGALAWEIGVFGLEGRLDVTDVGFEFTGARYDLRFNPPVFGVTGGSVTLGDGRFDANRLKLLSLNVRLRTPGPVSLVASGGLTYLPDFDVTGSVPVGFELTGLPPQPQPELGLRLAPGESDHRVGVNGGLGLRVGGRVAVFAEGRVFYFREYELRFAFDDAQPFVNSLLDNVEPVGFEPVIANAVAGLVLRF